jgi:hypothetical protein
VLNDCSADPSHTALQDANPRPASPVQPEIAAIGVMSTHFLSRPNSHVEPYASVLRSLSATRITCQTVHGAESAATRRGRGRTNGTRDVLDSSEIAVYTPAG